MLDRVPLDEGEIRTLLLLAAHYQRAVAQAQTAEEINAAYMQQLRDKYKLGAEWNCTDVLVGFVRDNHDQND